ncbi:hypothetical protein LQV63_24985 [Paenibacillus profundus]|uniref:Uncharacterized protein n=1 Tax=Paenibacillus profundus TaxID=1173085 RepID=A0ABS8YLU4_9BACL|nr:hypothetical protein [Paenibacillus profundus]MCE5172532.1 hypothetical protein [Paenibacillus profundus]
MTNDIQSLGQIIEGSVGLMIKKGISRVMILVLLLSFSLGMNVGGFSSIAEAAASSATFNCTKYGATTMVPVGTTLPAGWIIALKNGDMITAQCLIGGATGVTTVAMLGSAIPSGWVVINQTSTSLTLQNANGASYGVT